MPIVYGPVKSKKLKSPKKKHFRDEDSEESEVLFTCQLCGNLLTKKNSLMCLNNNCQVRWHVLCLGKRFLDSEVSFIGTQREDATNENLLPVEGICPSCESTILWGDLIRKKNGCYSELSNVENLNDECI